MSGPPGLGWWGEGLQGEVTIVTGGSCVCVGGGGGTKGNIGQTLGYENEFVEVSR